MEEPPHTEGQTSLEKRSKRGHIKTVLKQAITQETASPHDGFLYRVKDGSFDGADENKLSKEDFEARMAIEPWPIREALPLFSIAMRVAGIWQPPESSFLFRYCYPLLLVFIAGASFALEVYFFTRDDSVIIGATVMMLLAMEALSLIFCVWFYFKRPHLPELLSMVPTRKRHLQRAKEIKYLAIVIMTTLVVLAGGATWVVVKYFTEGLNDAIVIISFFLYIPMIFVICVTVALFGLVMELGVIIVNNYHQIIQTDEVHSYSVYQLTQLHLKFVRNQVEQSGYKWRLYLSPMLVLSTSYLIVVGFLLLFGEGSTPILFLVRLGLFLMACFLLFGLLWPGSSLSDRCRKCIKYSNIAMASGHIVCRYNDRMTFIQYLVVTNSVFKIYGLVVDRRLVIRVFYGLATFVLVSLNRLGSIFSSTG